MDVWYDDGSGAADLNDLDISTVTTNWYLRLTADDTCSSSCGSSTSNVQIWGAVGYSVGGSATTDLVTTATATTNSETAYAAIADLTWGRIGSDTDLADGHIGYSSDNGTNYSTATSARVVTGIATSSTNVKYRLRLKEPTTISTTTRGIRSITIFRGMWLG